MGKFGGGLPGMIAGLGTLSFRGFHLFGLPSHGISLSFGPGVCSVTNVVATVVTGMRMYQ